MEAIVIALISAIGGGGLASLLLIYKKGDSIAVTTLKQALEALNDEVIKPLRTENESINKELKKLNNELVKLRKSLEKIPACPHADTCPVAGELRLASTESGAVKD